MYNSNERKKASNPLTLQYIVASIQISLSSLYDIFDAEDNDDKTPQNNNNHTHFKPSSKQRKPKLYFRDQN